MVLSLLLLLNQAQEPLPPGALARLGSGLLGKAGKIKAVAWSPDGARVAAGGPERGLQIWDARTWTSTAALAVPDSDLHALVFSPDGLLLASGHGLDPERGEVDILGPKLAMVCLWSAATWKETLRLDHKNSNVHAIAFSPDGATLATGDAHGGLRLWELPSGRRRAEMRAGLTYIDSLRVSPDGHRLASAADWRYWGGMCASEEPKPVALGFVQIWDLATGAAIATLPGKDKEYRGLHYSADGRTLSSMAGGELRSWDTRRSELLSETRVGGLGAVAFSTDGARAAVVGPLGDIQVVEASTGATLRTFRSLSVVVHALAFSPDGRRLVSGHGDGSALIWDLAALK